MLVSGDKEGIKEEDWNPVSLQIQPHPQYKN